MNSNLKLVLTFTSGILIGGLSVKLYIDYKQDKEYECDYDIEDDSYEERKKKREARIYHGVEEHKTEKEKEEFEEYERLLSTLDYMDDEEVIDSVDKQTQDAIKEEMEEMLDGITDIESVDVEHKPPYNISQDLYEDIDAFDSDEYIVYADGYVVDSYGLPVDNDDVLKTLGPNFERFFGTYAEDQIWIRNPELQMDFSVIKDLDKFIDVASPRIRKLAGL